MWADFGSDKEEDKQGSDGGDNDWADFAEADAQETTKAEAAATVNKEDEE